MNFNYEKPRVIIFIWNWTQIKNRERDTGEEWEIATKKADAVKESGGRLRGAWMDEKG